jgi:hypothetical protein
MLESIPCNAPLTVRQILHCWSDGFRFVSSDMVRWANRLVLSEHVTCVTCVTCADGDEHYFVFICPALAANTTNKPAALLCSHLALFGFGLKAKLSAVLGFALRFCSISLVLNKFIYSLDPCGWCPISSA